MSIQDRIVRYGDLQPCKTAFIDAHTPGSDQKENFTIIGGGVSESPDQHVHLTDKIGFNIGAAGQPPKCRNSLHSHTTAEVFFVLRGRWRFFWGRWGDAGEFVAEEGDIFNIPTGIFRGFENIGTDYGMIMAILGGDDAGGGVTWAPQVIEDARDHGLILGENGVLYDSKKGESLPHNVGPMPVLREEELKSFPEVPVEAVEPRPCPARIRQPWQPLPPAPHRPRRATGVDPHPGPQPPPLPHPRRPGLGLGSRLLRLRLRGLRGAATWPLPRTWLAAPTPAKSARPGPSRAPARAVRSLQLPR